MRPRGMRRSRMRSGRKPPYCFSTFVRDQQRRSGDHLLQQLVDFCNDAAAFGERADFDAERDRFSARHEYASTPWTPDGSTPVSTLAPTSAVTIVATIASVADGEDRLARNGDAPLELFRQSTFGRGFPYRFSLAEEVEHHHRVRRASVIIVLKMPIEMCCASIAVARPCQAEIDRGERCLRRDAKIRRERRRLPSDSPSVCLRALSSCSKRSRRQARRFRTPPRRRSFSPW